MEEFEKEKFYPLECNHKFCNNCFKEYIISKIDEGPDCIMANCLKFYLIKLL